MTHIIFALSIELKELFVKKCSHISYSKIMRGLVRAFISGQIKLEDLDLE